MSRWDWALAWHLLTVERTSSVNHKIEKRCSQRGEHKLTQIRAYKHIHTYLCLPACLPACVCVRGNSGCCAVRVSFGFKPHKSHLSAVVNMSYTHTQTHECLLAFGLQTMLYGMLLLGLVASSQPVELVSRRWATAECAATCSFVFHLAPAIALHVFSLAGYSSRQAHTLPHDFFICFALQ